MTRRAPLPAHVHGAAFHVRDGDFHESSRSRLRAADLQRPYNGIRSTGLDFLVLVDRCRAYEPLLREGEVFSHATAAALYGLPLPPDHGVVPPLEVTAPPGRARARSSGIVGHVASDAQPLRIFDGLPLIVPARAWCQLGARLSVPDLVAVGDAIVTGARHGTLRSPGLATLVELHDEVSAWGSRRGARALAAALPRVRVGSESRPETHLRLLLVDAGLPEPVLNDATVLHDGSILHPDLKYVRWRVVLEYQGDRHRTDRGRWQRDIRRKRAFERSGWRVVEVTSDDLYVDPAELLARLRDLIASA